MKKLFALLLALVMLFSLTACGSGSGSSEPTIVGTWKGSMDLSAVFAAAFQTELEDPISMGLTYTFREDGTYAVTVDEDSMDDLMDALVDVFIGIMAAMYGEEFDLDAMLAEEGMTKEEFTQQLMGSMDLNSMMEETEETGYYKYENGRIYSAEDKEDLEGDPEDLECMVVTLSGNTLTITDIEQDGEKMSEIMPDVFPMVFTKQ